jgi:hypothetical protein
VQLMAVRDRLHEIEALVAGGDAAQRGKDCRFGRGLDDAASLRQ